MDRPVENTDTTLFVESPDDHYSSSLHKTRDGKIGIQVGGHVFVKSLSEWHELAVKDLKDEAGQDVSSETKGKAMRELVNWMSKHGVSLNSTAAFHKECPVLWKLIFPTEPASYDQDEGPTGPWDALHRQLENTARPLDVDKVKSKILAKGKPVPDAREDVLAQISIPGKTLDYFYAVVHHNNGTWFPRDAFINGGKIIDYVPVNEFFERLPKKDNTVFPTERVAQYLHERAERLEGQAITHSKVGNTHAMHERMNMARCFRIVASTLTGDNAG